MKHKSFFAVLALMLLAGCASDGDVLKSQGQSPVYADAFDDGCSSGYNAGGNMFYTFKKNVAMAGSNPQYAQGWADGYQQCYGRQTSAQTNMQTEYMRENLQLNKDAAKNNQYKGYVKPGVDYDPGLLNSLGR